jgi:thiamine-phosphate pyrophosphorylase
MARRIPVTRLMVLTGRRMADQAGHRLDEVVARVAAAGATAVVLREKDLGDGERRALAERLRAVTAESDVALVVAGDPELAVAVGADGVHVAADGPWLDDRTRRALRAAAPGRPVVGRSCHTPSELQAAAQRGRADYVTYSPVFATPSKPGHGPAIGLDGLSGGRLAVDGAGGPLRSVAGRLRRSYLGAATAAPLGRVGLVALGGIGPGRAGACRRAGADGVALMGEVMRAADPGAVMAQVAAEMVEVDAARRRRHG